MEQIRSREARPRLIKRSTTFESLDADASASTGRRPSLGHFRQSSLDRTASRSLERSLSRTGRSISARRASLSNRASSLSRSRRRDRSESPLPSRLASTSSTPDTDTDTATHEKPQPPDPSAEIDPQPDAQPSDAEPKVQIPGLRYAEINLNGFTYTTALMRQLSWTATAQLLWLFAMGYKPEAISILGSQVIQHRGLIGLALDSLAHSRAQIGGVFAVLASGSSSSTNTSTSVSTSTSNAHHTRLELQADHAAKEARGEENATYPVLVHCMHGKDRTGLIILLVLLLCGVEPAVIEQDYLASNTHLQGTRAERVAEFAVIGLPATFADCAPGWVDAVVAHVEGVGGGIEAFLVSCGVTVAMQERVREVLVVSR